jgi:hypothetical protein
MEVQELQVSSKESFYRVVLMIKLQNYERD